MSKQYLTHRDGHNFERTFYDMCRCVAERSFDDEGLSIMAGDIECQEPVVKVVIDGGEASFELRAVVEFSPESGVYPVLVFEMIEDDDDGEYLSQAVIDKLRGGA